MVVHSSNITKNVEPTPNDIQVGSIVLFQQASYVKAGGGPWEGGNRWHQGIITCVYQSTSIGQILYDGHHTRDENDGKICNYSGYAWDFNGLQLKNLRSCPTMENRNDRDFSKPEANFQQVTIQNDNTINNDIVSPSMRGGNEIQDMVAGQMNDVLRYQARSSQALPAAEETIRNDNTINNDVASPSMRGGNEIQVIVAGQMNDVLRYQARSSQVIQKEETIRNDNTINNDIVSPSMRGGNKIQDIVAGQMNDVLRYPPSASQALPTAEETIRNDNTINNDVVSPSMRGENEIQDIVAGQMKVLRF